MHLHRAERADRLVDALAAVVDGPGGDPFAREVVAVPSRGIERWLQQTLSLRLGAAEGGRDGVCANIDFPFPGVVVARALRAARATRAEADPWAPNRLVWPLLATIDAELARDWMGPLRTHLGGPPERADATRRIRRYAAARHLADLYDRYGVHRPEMLLAWADGKFVDGSGDPLLPDTRWQARLWCLLREQLPVPPPAARLDETTDALRSGLEVPDLPRRFGVFGLTALPASYMRVLDALAVHRDVHLFLLHPSPTLWGRVAQSLAEHGIPRDRDADQTRDSPANPLLASWGRDAREMQIVVAGAGGASDGRPPTARAGDQHLPLHGAEPRTLLARIQADIREDRVPAGDPPTDRRPPLEPGDRSVQIHACHGKTRQVEVLRDAILHLLVEDPTLQPRDILVMCPDIEAFAPIVEAVFNTRPAAGEDDPHPPPPVADAGTAQPGPDARTRDGQDERTALPDLRVRLADRAIRQTNPVLRVVADLLELAGSRLTASEVLDLAGRQPVRRRFRLDDEDLTRIEQWVTAAGIRWGLHTEHRAAFGLGDVGANTWRAGLDRILLGVTMADEEERLVEGTVPLDDVEGAEVDTAGRFAELLDRLDTIVAGLRGPHGIAGWVAAIAEAADLLTATTERDRWQHLQLHRVLGEVLDEATPATADGGAVAEGTPIDVPLTLPEVRALLEDRLRGRPSRANHRTGDLTVCTLVPMRSVPHRVVCLLGMDDGAFPRRVVPDGDDLLDRRPHVGDRDTRTEDRQLLLDALLAATDRLVVTYTGQDVRTNDRRPPAVPIGELLDVIDRTVRRDGGDARSAVHVQHALQPFDPRNFAGGAFGVEGPWSFDPAALAGARARRQVGRERRFLRDSLDPLTDDRVDVADLTAFVEHPVRAFLRRRLDVSLPRGGDDPSDAIPLELVGLDRWKVGDRLLRACQAGVDLTRATAAERARGTVPPGSLAHGVLDDVAADVDAILAVAAMHLRDRGGDIAAAHGHRDLAVDLPDGRTLVGSVTGASGDALVTVQYAKVGPKHRLAAWVRLLAVTLADPDRPWCALTIGRGPRKAKPIRIACVQPLGDTPVLRRAAALAHLPRIVDLYDRGMRAPLPLYCKTSAAYADAAISGDRDPREAARREWTEGTFSESAENEHVLVLGEHTSFDRLLEEPVCADEHGDGWAGDESTRFGRYARRLWEGLAEHEELVDCRRPE